MNNLHLVHAHYAGILNVFFGIVALVLVGVISAKTVKLLRMHVGFILVLLTYGMWDIFIGIGELNHGSPTAALFWNKMQFTATLAIAATFLFSYMAFDKKVKPILWALVFAPAAALAVLAHTSLGVTGCLNGDSCLYITGPVGYVTDAWILVFLGWSLLNLWRGYSSTSGAARLQMEYMLLGLIVTLVAAVFAWIAVPVLQLGTVVTYAPGLSMIFFVAAGYAMLNRNLLGVELVAYDISRLFAAMLVLLGLNGLLYLLAKGIFSNPGFFSSSISLIVVALLYFATPIEKGFAQLLSRVMLNRRVKYQKLLSDCSMAVTSILEVDKLLQYIIVSLAGALGSTRIAIFMKERIDKEELFRLSASFGISEVTKSCTDNKNVLRWFENNKRPFIIDRLWQNDKDNKDLMEFFKTYEASLVVPLVYKGEVVGLITLNQKMSDGGIFDIDDIEVLESLAGSLAVSLENAKLYTNLNNAYMSITRSLAVAVETRDPFMTGHSDNVTKYALSIAKKMGIAGNDLIQVVQAAMLHDLGKIGVHDAILCKPGKLTEEEWVEMKLHTVKGSKILEPLPFMKEVSRIVRYHHERFDGTGYPEGLPASKIPIGSQILSVADSFDAMVSPRQYRAGKDKNFSVERAIDELKKNRGTQFNPEIVDTFLGILKESPNLINRSSFSPEVIRL